MEPAAGPQPIAVIAHRTCPRDAPENSLEGIQRAADLGADFVEVDARRTRDGVVVLLHDPLLWRTARRPWPVRMTPSSRATSLTLQRTTSRLPTLAQALAALPAGLGMAIDIKDAGAAEAVVAEVRNQQLLTRVLLWSQHVGAVQWCARAAPETERALLRDTSTPAQSAALVSDACAAGATGISAHWDVVDDDLATRCRAQGLALYAWCQNLQPEPHKLRLLTGIVTDWPVEARAAARAAG